jgi:ribonuclease HI
MPWQTRMLRGQRVWAKVKADGALEQGPDGRVDVLYQLGGKTYRAGGRNLEPDLKVEMRGDDDVATAGPASEKAGATAKKRSVKMGRPAEMPENAVIVYTDGACTGNPGPMGIGVVIIDGEKRREISEYLGHGTNNIAELTAIVRALQEVPRDRPIMLHSDSAYALGLLGQGWKAKANQDVVEKMRMAARVISQLILVKVAGHAGVPENERCDELARDAITGR